MGPLPALRRHLRCLSPDPLLPRSPVYSICSVVFLLSMLAQGANGEAAYTVDKVATQLAERQFLYFGGADKVTFLWLPAEHSPAWCKEGGCLLPCHAPSLPPS